MNASASSGGGYQQTGETTAAAPRIVCARKSAPPRAEATTTPAAAAILPAHLMLTRMYSRTEEREVGNLKVVKKSKSKDSLSVLVWLHSTPTHR